MRPSLLAVSVLALSACASSGRPSTGGHDAHVTPPDGGGHADMGVSTPDMGTATPDMGTTTPDTGETMPDAGHDGAIVLRPDAFVLDTGTMAPDTGCANDAQCSDGLGCNGAERCVLGACQAATAPMDCNDSLACTTDSCSEPGMCNHVSTCGAGSSCSATGCSTGCAESPCRLLSPQCGCAAGQACYPTGATRSCAAVGTSTSGMLCTNNSSCTAGNVCLNVSSGTTPVNVCTRMCTMDSECGGGLCEYSLDDGSGGAVPGFKLCTHPCNAATNAGCATGSVCTLFQETTGAMRNYTDCIAPTTGGGEDAQCTSGTECSPDRYCADTNDGSGLGSRCHHWCNVTTGAGCPTRHTCLGFTMPIVISGITYGVCSL